MPTEIELPESPLDDVMVTVGPITTLEDEEKSPVPDELTAATLK